MTAARRVMRRLLWIAAGCIWRLHKYDERPEARSWIASGHHERFIGAHWRCTRCGGGLIRIRRGDSR